MMVTVAVEPRVLRTLSSSTKDTSSDNDSTMLSDGQVSPTADNSNKATSSEETHDLAANREHPKAVTPLAQGARPDSTTCVPKLPGAQSPSPDTASRNTKSVGEATLSSIHVAYGNKDPIDVTTSDLPHATGVETVGPDRKVTAKRNHPLKNRRKERPTASPCSPTQGHHADAAPSSPFSGPSKSTFEASPRTNQTSSHATGSGKEAPKSPHAMTSHLNPLENAPRAPKADLERERIRCEMAGLKSGGYDPYGRHSWRGGYPS